MIVRWFSELLVVCTCVRVPWSRFPRVFGFLMVVLLGILKASGFSGFSAFWFVWRLVPLGLGFVVLVFCWT